MFAVALRSCVLTSRSLLSIIDYYCLLCVLTSRSLLSSCVSTTATTCMSYRYLEKDYLPPNPREAVEGSSEGGDNGVATAPGGDNESVHVDMVRERMARNIIEWVAYLIVSKKAFDVVIYMCICGNTLALALEFHGSPVLLGVVLSWANMVFTYIFTVEMLLKLAAYVGVGSLLLRFTASSALASALASPPTHTATATTRTLSLRAAHSPAPRVTSLSRFSYGIGGYCGDRMNTLDAAVTILGLVEMLFTASSALVAFRAVRFFRLFRLMRYMQSLQKIIQVIASSFMSILYATLLLLLFSFIFTIFGMQVRAAVPAPALHARLQSTLGAAAARIEATIVRGWRKQSMRVPYSFSLPPSIQLHRSLPCPARTRAHSRSLLRTASPSVPMRSSSAASLTSRSKRLFHPATTSITCTTHSLPSFKSSRAKTGLR